MSTATGTAEGDLVQAVRAAARAYERDRYLAALLAPRAYRADLVALAAFAGEIARIPGDVSEPMLGEIRLQWWRDALDGALGGTASATGHPIADAFFATARRRGIPAREIAGVIDAMTLRLDDQPFVDLDGLRAHLAGWDGGLFALAWRLGGGQGAPPAMLGAAGEVYGLSRCLLEAPAELAQGRIILPKSHLSEHGLSLETARSPDAAPCWRRMNAVLAAHIARHLPDVLRNYQRADPHARLAALPLALVRPYLRVSQQADVAALEARDLAPLTRVWRLWLAHRTGLV